jgi:hypothetical protein
MAPNQSLERTRRCSDRFAASTQGLDCCNIVAQKVAMTEPSKFHQPAPMEGRGAYNRSSFVQAAGSLPAVALLERAAHAVALPPSPDPVFIADYGSSEGLAEGAEIGRQSRIHFANALRTTRSTQAFAKTLGLMGSTRQLELPALLLFR